MDTVVDELRQLLASYTEPCVGDCDHSQCPLLRELHALAISNVLEQARQTVKPVVDAERKGEEVGDLMNMRLRAPSPVAATVDAETPVRCVHCGATEHSYQQDWDHLFESLAVAAPSLGSSIQAAAAEIDDLFDAALQGGRLYADGFNRGEVKLRIAVILSKRLGSAAVGEHAELQRRLFDECVTANWDPERKNTFAEEIAHLHEELSEAFRAWRKYKDCEIREVNGKLEGVPIEFADVLIGMFYNAELHGFNLLEAVERKHQFNLSRNYVAEGRQLHTAATPTSTEDKQI